VVWAGRLGGGAVLMGRRPAGRAAVWRRTLVVTVVRRVHALRAPTLVAARNREMYSCMARSGHPGPHECFKRTKFNYLFL
jgi:hypothetical protein